MAAEAAMWLWSEAVEGEVSDTEPRMTRKEHEALWERYMKQWRSECVRMRNCYGCVYLSSCGSSLCCSHILETGSRRPCAFDSQQCTAKKTFPGWKPTPEYKAFLRETKKAEKEAAVVKSAKSPAKRNRAKWDTEYAYALFQQKYSTGEIATIMGVKRNAVVSYANAHNWRCGRHTIQYPTHQGRDLTAEIEAYRRYREQKEKEAERQTG